MDTDVVPRVPEVEPWLRGPISGVHPLLAPTLHAYRQAIEDVARWTEGLDTNQIWARPEELAPVGFHLRHIAGSVDRLTTYLRGEQLTAQQMETMRQEMNPDAGRAELLRGVSQALAASEEVIRSLQPSSLVEPRSVGRKRLPTTVIGLVVHLAEHTQRHVGELIITAKLSKKIVTGSTRPKSS